MNIGTLSSLTLRGYPNTGPKSLTYSIDMRLVNQRSQTHTIDMVLQATNKVTYAVDMVLQGANSTFYALDMVLADPNHDNGSWQVQTGSGITQPIDPNRIAVWSTYTRPSNPIDGQAGVNHQTSKIEYYDGKTSLWRNADGSAA